MSQARVSITPSDAWSDQRLTPLQCRLLGLIGSFLGKDHRAWPSQNTLADRLGVSRKAVNDGIKALKKYGYIEVEHRKRDDGGQTSNCYFVRMDPVSRDLPTPCKAGVTPLSPQGDTPCNPLEVTPPVTPEGDTMKDPLERPNEEEARFEEAWNTYRSCPLKARQTKKLAKAQWPRAIKKADPETILKAIQQEVRDRTNPTDFIGSLPDMHRWLRDERWSDVETNSSQPDPESQPLENWQAAARDYCENHIWDRHKFGPAPHEPGCKAPAGLLTTISKRMANHRWADRIKSGVAA